MATKEVKVVRFGAFEVEIETRELRKSGLRVKLQDQPFRLLAALLAKPGEVVTRDELQRELWPETEYGEFDDRLATAVRKLRRALNDSSANPRFIETLPKVGFRFIGAVETVALPPEHSTARRPPSRRIWLAFAILVAAFAASAITYWFTNRNASPTVPERLVFFVEKDPELKRLISEDGITGGPRISPDGRSLAYAIRESLWIRDLASGEARLLVRFDDVIGGRCQSPVWSPDSTVIAFTREKKLLAVSVPDKTVRVICEECVWSNSPVAVDWSPNGNSIVSIWRNQLLKIPVGGGAPEVILKHDGPGVLANPIYLSEERLAFSSRASADDTQMIGLDIASGDTWPLGSGIAFDYSSTGHLIHKVPGESSGLWALPIARDGRPAGDSFQIQPHGDSAYVSTDGTLVFHVNDKPQSQMSWRSRDGKSLGRFGGIMPSIVFPRLSPNGRWAMSSDLENGDLWIHEGDRPVARRIRTEGVDSQASWSWDSERIVYVSEFPGQKGTQRIFLRDVDEGGRATPITSKRGPTVPQEYFENFPSFSPDGATVIYHSFSAETQRDLHYLRRREDGSFTDSVFLKTPYSEREAVFSPDGRYVAYGSDISGREEVYVSDFPEAKNRWQVSVGGGMKPRWRRDGAEILYVQDSTLFGVAVTASPKFSVSQPERLFRARSLRSGHYDVTKDGSRIALVDRIGPLEPPTTYLWQNWFSSFSD